MKKIYLMCGAAALMLSACGGGAGNGNAGSTQNSDSALTEQQIDSVAGPTAYYLTCDSLGPVRVGELISDLPAAVPNLYDMMITTETPDAMAYTFLLGDVPQFSIYDFMEGKVDVIVLEDNARSIMTPDGEIRQGDPFNKVLALKGVQSEWVNLDDSGIWYWKWNGLYFGVDEGSASDKLDEALCDGKRPPRAADFNDKVKIGYIATGLPF